MSLTIVCKHLETSFSIKHKGLANRLGSEDGLFLVDFRDTVVDGCNKSPDQRTKLLLAQTLTSLGQLQFEIGPGTNLLQVAMGTGGLLQYLESDLVGLRIVG